MEALWFFVGIQLGICTTAVVICSVQISQINARHRKRHEQNNMKKNN